jgi:uncharacterized membrane protein YgcG
MKRLLALAAFVLAAGFASAQNCDSIVNDEAGIIRDPTVITQGIAPLTTESADVRIVTVKSIAKYGPRLQSVEDFYESHCPSWKDANGHRKTNLFVMMVAPGQAKNVFLGSAYSHVFQSQDDVNNTYTKAASPYFHNEQWEQGFAAAAKDFGARVAAYHDQQKHPVVVPPATTTTNNNYDFSFLKSFAYLFFGALALFGVGWAIVAFFGRRRRMSDDTIEAQTKAMAEWNATNSAYLSLPKDNKYYGTISQQFSDLSNSVKYNPNEKMSKAEYIAAGGAWRDMRNLIQSATAPKQEPSGTGAQSKPKHQAPKKQHVAPFPESEMPKHKTAPPTPQPVVIREREIVRESGDSDLLAGVVIGDMLGSRSRDPEPYREPEHREPTEPESKSIFSGSDTPADPVLPDSGVDSGSDTPV